MQLVEGPCSNYQAIARSAPSTSSGQGRLPFDKLRAGMAGKKAAGPFDKLTVNR